MPIYNITDSELGRLLVGGTEKGICAVSLGDTDIALEQELMQQYPKAQLNKNDSNLNRWLDLLKSYIADRQEELTLPLDIRGTAFQQQVWEKLQGIPCGTTSTYSQIARDLGRPKAARAVALACAANSIALAIPCHRVLRSDGSLGGYRWGLQRKQALLEKEYKLLDNINIKSR
ncbi:MAG: methylated-DNA--[protein]-cysteine S-methyltransferase [Oscillatoria sp. SIO1A7]|nr:methylated-DNA--[protein]-cysteine S-methyltransferase [Oscillatoria sp. SIO1A7]